MIEIRELTVEELDGLAVLLEQLWTDRTVDSGAVRRVMEKGLGNDGQIYLCATEGRKLAGYGSLSIKNSLWMGANLGYVDELVVEREYRNRGIGRMLMTEIERIAGEGGCRRLELDSAFHRTDTHAFYGKLGFEKRAFVFTKEI